MFPGCSLYTFFSTNFSDRCYTFPGKIKTLFDPLAGKVPNSISSSKPWDASTSVVPSRISRALSERWNWPSTYKAVRSYAIWRIGKCSTSRIGWRPIKTWTSNLFNHWPTNTANASPGYIAAPSRSARNLCACREPIHHLFKKRYGLIWFVILCVACSLSLVTELTSLPI